MNLRKLSPEDKEALIQGVIAQLEKDFEDQDYESMDEMLSILLQSKKNANVLYQYLGDDIQERLQEGKLHFKY